MVKPQCSFAVVKEFIVHYSILKIISTESDVPASIVDGLDQLQVSKSVVDSCGLQNMFDSICQSFFL